MSIDRRRSSELLPEVWRQQACHQASAESTLRRFKAIAFDGFPIIDPRPVFAKAEEIFPGKGADLSNAWRTRQFEYQWLRTLSGGYADFLKTTQDALVFAAKSLQLELTGDKRDQLMQAYLELKTWPDGPAALRSLKIAGLRLVFVSNMTRNLLDAGIRNNGSTACSSMSWQRCMKAHNRSARLRHGD
jgi:2-haloacid dehalogenase